MATGNTNGLIKALLDIMRQDAGLGANFLRIEQMSWMFFLKAYDAKEEEWELMDPEYTSLIPENCKWRNWAVAQKDTLTGDELLHFVNDTLFPTLKTLPITAESTMKQAIVRYVFEDTNQYMKDGVLLRQVIDKIESSVNFNEFTQRHAFGDMYERLLKSLGEAKDSGEYYTPRAVTDFMVQMIKPQLGETIADFACGTGGFLTSSLNYLKNQRSSTDDVRKYNESVFGIEKKSVPYLLCMTNMLIHDVDDPKIYHDNSLEKNIRDYTPSDKFDIILMNPPYGGTEKPEVQQNFPVDYRSSETADLFVDVIMARLKGNGRCGVVLPDGFLFTNTGVKSKIKEKLFKEFNVHTIIRLPHDVFAPYTNITTNILFFDKSGPTKETWFYRLDMPEGYKHFSKTKPILIDHFEPAVEWWNDRKPLQDEDGNPKAKCFSSTELEKTGYDLDLCGFPHEEEEVLEPLDLISKYQTEKNELDENIRNVLQQIEDLINKK